MKRTFISIIAALAALATLGAAAQEPVRTAFMSYDRFEDAVSFDRTKSPFFVSLDGEWEFDDGSGPGRTIAVPGYFAERSAEALAALRPPALPVAGPTVICRRRVEIPLLWLDRDIFVRVEGLKGGLKLYVNGREAGSAEGTGIPVEFNIAPWATDGVNEIAFELAAWSAADWLRNDSLDAAGIEGGVSLWSQYRIHIDDFTARATLDSLGTAGLLDLDVALVNGFNYPDTATLHYYILDEAGKVVRRNSRQAIIPGRGRDTVSFAGRLPDVRPWSPTSPARYRMMLRLDYRGHIAEYIPVRIGFRSLERSETGYFLNGNPMNIREQSYDFNGLAPTPAAMRADLLTIKEAGNNTIRCGYHPLKAVLYDLCAELGLLVIDQAPIDTTLTGTDPGVGGTLSNDPAWLDAYLSRAENSWRAARNMPNVVAFSLGAGPGVGYNIYEAYLRLKALEPLRPIVYAPAGELWCNDKF